MRYNAHNPDLFRNNRERFTARMKPNSIAVFNSNDVLPTNADGTMHFVQNSDLFWLSGIDQEESVLVLFPDARNAEMRELLFLRETNETIAIWEGERLTKERARAISGIENVYWLSSLESVLNSLILDAETVYLNTNEHRRNGTLTETRDRRFINWCKEKYPLHEYRRSAPLLHDLRQIKNEWEVEAIRHACSITGKGFRRLLSFVRPGVWEYEVEAELLHEFIRSRSRGFAYEPIIASGADACVLHYVVNNKQCQDGDLLLLDVAAEYANYKSDLTRTIPVNGRFTPRQRQVYDAVLRVFRQAASMLTPAYSVMEYNKAVGEIMNEELIGLGLYTAEEAAQQNPASPLYKRYFMHGTSHHLGLDVHDYGRADIPIQPGMVFTCEPGIYIREEGIGIRLENDFVVTETGQIDLMADIPIEAEEIEDLMNAGR